jgi:hypothetical protein
VPRQSSAKLCDAHRCGGVVSLLANEQWDEREGSELSGVKAKSSPRAPLSRALRSPLFDLLRRFLI